jgi:hypothetical protein
MSAHPVRFAAQGGFAYVALLVLTSVVGLVGAVALDGLVRRSTALPAVAAERLVTVAATAAGHYRLTGVLPTNLAALPVGAANAEWRRDPWGAGTDLDYRIRQRNLELRSRGPDGRFRTADDDVLVVDDEPLLRLRQRGRLRILRAVLTDSSFRNSISMPVATRQQMVAAMRQVAIARRSWYFADAATRVALTTQLAAAQQFVVDTSASFGLSPLPVGMLGGTGLLAALGLPDTRAVDALGRAMAVDPVLGFVAHGGDRAGGTDDDM